MCLDWILLPCQDRGQDLELFQSLGLNLFPVPDQQVHQVLYNMCLEAHPTVE